MGRERALTSLGFLLILFSLGLFFWYSPLNPFVTPKFLPELLEDPPYAEGPPAAPKLVVEFLSPTCPFCRRHHQEVYPYLKGAVAQGKLRLVYRVVPVDEAGSLLLCTGEDFPRALEALFAMDPKVDPKGFLEGVLGRSLGDCPKGELRERELELARRAGVRGTPTFFLLEGGNWVAKVGFQPLGFWKGYLE